jgi:glucosamine--fructose-6-phosphate aminotransferase (isomerizing)
VALPLPPARAGHPFYMHDAVLAQPAAFGGVVDRLAPALDAFAARAHGSARWFLVGTGTSFHAARIGEHLLRAYGGEPEVRAYPAFDFALYGPSLTAADCVIGISHRGSKLYTVRSLRRARDAGCRTALVTGQGGSVGERPEVDAAFETVPQEASATHTVSYTASVAALAEFAACLGAHRTGTRRLPERILREDVPEALRAALAREPQMAAWAREHAGRRRIWLTGAGPSAVTAEEIALKIKEAAYLAAEGLPAETLHHGPFQCADPADVFVLVAPAGEAQERVLAFGRMAEDIGAAALAVADGRPPGAPPAEHAAWCLVPPVPPPFEAVTCLVPLQLFSYHLALVRGTNPDVFRLDDPRFALARTRARL